MCSSDAVINALFTFDFLSSALGMNYINNCVQLLFHLRLLLNLQISYWNCTHYCLKTCKSSLNTDVYLLDI